MYAYCTSSHMSKQFKKWPIKYHFGWLSWPAKTHIKYCTLDVDSVLDVHVHVTQYNIHCILLRTPFKKIHVPTCTLI